MQCNARQCQVLGLGAARTKRLLLLQTRNKMQANVFWCRTAPPAEQAGSQAFRGAAQRRAVARPSDPQKGSQVEVPEFAERGQKRSCRYLHSAVLRFRGAFLANSPEGLLAHGPGSVLQAARPRAGPYRRLRCVFWPVAGLSGRIEAAI